jgi:hypothetical protein
VLRYRGANLGIKTKYERIFLSYFFRICNIIFYICTVFYSKQLLKATKSTVVGFCLSSPDGGIGRRAGLKHLWETVPVRLRLRVQKALLEKKGFFFGAESNIFCLTAPGTKSAA